MIPLDTSLLVNWAGAFIWPFIRVLAFMITAPVFDHPSLNRMTRVLLSAAIAIVIAPGLGTPIPISSPDSTAILLQQIIAGATMGFAFKIAFTAFDIAGAAVGLQMGLGFAQFVDPQKGSTPLISNFYGILASLIFLSLNGHILMLSAVVKSFSIVPIGPELDVTRPESIAMAGALMFSLGLTIAMPVLAAILITNAILGILARTAPQLNILSIGFSLTIFLGLYILYLSMPFLIPAFEQVIDSMLKISILRPPGT